MLQMFLFFSSVARLEKSQVRVMTRFRFKQDYLAREPNLNFGDSHLETEIIILPRQQPFEVSPKHNPVNHTYRSCFQINTIQMLYHKATRSCNFLIISRQSQEVFHKCFIFLRAIN